MKTDIMVEKYKGRGYKYPFKLSILIHGGMYPNGIFASAGFQYKGAKEIARYLEIDTKEYIAKVQEYKGKFFGENDNTFFKNKEQAAKFSNEYLVPYMVAKRLKKAK